MIPTFSFDLATMSLWVDPSFIMQSGTTSYLQRVLNHGINGEVDEAVSVSISEAGSEQELLRTVELLSCIWHEQKHFFDFAFTNYGAYRIRQYFEIYVNYIPVLDSLVDGAVEISFPLDAILDPVRKDILGIGNVPKHFEDFARAILKRKKRSQLDRQTIILDGVKYELGGEAQLEALAYITQVTAIQEYFGTQTSYSVQKLTPDRIKSNQKYNWFIKISRHFGLLPLTKKDDIVFLDLSALLPILYASLFNTYRGQAGINPDTLADIPSYRLGYLIQEVIKDRDAYLKLDLQGKWDHINTLCKAKWNRTIIEEFENDLEADRNFLDTIRANKETIFEEVIAIIEDYHKLRIAIFDQFKRDPISIIDPKEFVNTLLPDVLPIPVIAYPHGEDVNHPAFNRVLGFRDGANKWDWAVTPKVWEPLAGQFALTDISSWSYTVSEFAPLAKLLINGRNHKTMLGPELFVLENMFQTHGYKYRFDPLFEFPDEKNAIDYYYHLSGRSDAVCDICQEAIKKPDGHLLSPWVFRYTLKNAEQLIMLYGGIDNRAAAWRDWSYWVVCDRCYAILRSRLDWRD